MLARIRLACGLVTLLLATTASAAPPAAVRADHPGPLGLAWGKSPADARSILAGKLTFVSEEPAEEGGYHTIDQHYSGTFGGLPTTDVLLRFYKGAFFYMLVKPSLADAGGSPSKIFEAVVDRMRAAYGAPGGLRQPPRLASDFAILDHLPLADREKLLPYLWNEQQRKDDAAFYRLRDHQILLGHWDPFAAWRFRNRVLVQTFLWQAKTTAPGATPGFQAGMFTPVWIFAKEDVFKTWRATVGALSIVPPRDF